MDDKRTERGGRPAMVLGLVAVLTLLPALYVLSIGPVIAMFHLGWIDHERIATIEAAYYPIFTVVGNYEEARSLYVNYVNLWLPAEYEAY